MILARQGLMEGIYQYMDDAEDWTGQSAGASDAAMLQALTRESRAHGINAACVQTTVFRLSPIPKVRNFRQCSRPMRYPASGQSRIFFSADS